VSLELQSLKGIDSVLAGASDGRSHFHLLLAGPIPIEKRHPRRIIEFIYLLRLRILGELSLRGVSISLKTKMLSQNDEAISLLQTKP
jgi:hypothetical protein